MKSTSTGRILVSIGVVFVAIGLLWPILQGDESGIFGLALTIFIIVPGIAIILAGLTALAFQNHKEKTTAKAAAPQLNPSSRIELQKVLNKHLVRTIAFTVASIAVYQIPLFLNQTITPLEGHGWMTIPIGIVGLVIFILFLVGAVGNAIKTVQILIRIRTISK